MPTRNSRTGLLSRLPLRGWSQVRLVSQPTGAAATRRRSSFPLAAAGGGAVCAPATVTTQARTPSMPSKHPRRSNFCIVLSSFVALAHARCEGRLALVPSVASRRAPPPFDECRHLAQAIGGPVLPAEPHSAR